MYVIASCNYTKQPTETPTFGVMIVGYTNKFSGQYVLWLASIQKLGTRVYHWIMFVLHRHTERGIVNVVYAACLNNLILHAIFPGRNANHLYFIVTYLF